MIVYAESRFQTQISVNSKALIFVTTLQSMSVPSIFIRRYIDWLSKSFILSVAVDVVKSSVIACIASTDLLGITTYKRRRYYTFIKDLHLLAVNSCRDVCMEFTGKYWIPVYNVLETSCCIVRQLYSTLRNSSTPRSNESADKKKITRISRSGAYLKPLLV